MTSYYQCQVKLDPDELAVVLYLAERFTDGDVGALIHAALEDQHEELRAVPLAKLGLA